jgi:hypothetical protein
MMDRVWLLAGRLAPLGKPVTRRALRAEGVRGSNEAPNALARELNAEIARAAASPPVPDSSAA